MRPHLAPSWDFISSCMLLSPHPAGCCCREFSLHFVHWCSCPHPFCVTYGWEYSVLAALPLPRPHLASEYHSCFPRVSVFRGLPLPFPRGVLFFTRGTLATALSGLLPAPVNICSVFRFCRKDRGQRTDTELGMCESEQVLGRGRASSQG